MMDFDALLSMGGYAGFVWPAYGLAVAVLVGLLATSLNMARTRESELDVLQQMRGRRRGANPEA